LIVEVRKYKIKPGRRDDFIRFFESPSIAMPMIESYEVVLTESTPGGAVDSMK